MSRNCPAFMLTTSSWSFFFKSYTKSVLTISLICCYGNTRAHYPSCSGCEEASDCTHRLDRECLAFWHQAEIAYRGEQQISPSSPQPFFSSECRGWGRGISKMLFLSFICCTDTETRWRCFRCFRSLHSFIFVLHLHISHCLFPAANQLSLGKK